MKTIRVLILEDDLQTLSAITAALFELEESLVGKMDFAVTIFSEYKEVERYLNRQAEPGFDIILLDRDSKEGGSFHALDIKKFGIEKIIAISTQPEYNAEIEKLGVTRTVRKDYSDLDDFGRRLIDEIIKQQKLL